MEQHVAVIGSGLIGRAWAISFARGGRAVRLWDPDPEAVGRALEAIRTALQDLETYDLLGGQGPEAVLARVEPVADLEAAVCGADYVQESGPERLEAKREIFTRLDHASAPETVLASSTSGILPSAFSEGLAGKARCLVAHPINPPYLVPAVELVPAPWTDPAAMAAARDLLASVGQVPLTMSREITGFIMNRLQSVLIHEAFRLVADGYATPEDVDRGVCEGIGLRWSFIGPFETSDLNAPGGIRDYVARYSGLHQGVAEVLRDPPDWTGAALDRIEETRRGALPVDRIAERQQWRDRRLMALIAHKRRSAED